MILYFFRQSLKTAALCISVLADDFVGAHRTLCYLAASEQASMLDKKCFLSLGKLAAAFSDEPEAVVKENIEGAFLVFRRSPLHLIKQTY